MASQFPGDRPTPITPPPPPYSPGPDAAGIIARVRAIVVSPQTEWPRIAAEPATVRGLFTNYAAPLAAIGPIAGLIGSVLFFHGSLLAGLLAALVTFAISLGVTYVMALIVNALAPTLGGTKDMVQATKLVVYSYTPAWVAGALNIIPPLGVIGSLIGLYSLYLLWLGLPVLMRSPAEKTVGYFVVTLLVAIGLGIVVSLVIGAIMASILLAFVSTASTGAGMYH